MVFIPLLFFGLLFISSYKKKGVDLGRFMILMYVVTSLFAVLLLYANPDEVLDDCSQFRITVVPVIMYCGMLGLSLMPYSRINTNRKRLVYGIKNTGFFNKIAILYFILFFVMLALCYDDIFNGILQQNLNDMRKMSHENEIESVYTRYSGLTKVIIYAVGAISGGANYMILFFFYSICFTNNSRRFNLMIIIGSLTTVLNGMLNVDRSCVIRWLLLFLVSFFLFRPYITQQAKKFLFKIGLVILGTLGSYFFVVTFARFFLDMGMSGSILSYIGQPFLNFCNIWDNVEVTSYTTRKILPAINEFFLHTERSKDALVIKGADYVRVNGFQTYFGELIMEIGKFWSCVFVILITIIANKICKKINNKKAICFKDFVYVYMVAIISVYGTIAYIYSNYGETLNLFFMLFLLSKIKYERVPVSTV